MKDMDMKDDVYRTSDMGFASYLLAKQYYCVGAVPANSPDPNRKDFVFIGIENPKVLEAFYFRYDKEELSPRTLFEKSRTALGLAKKGLTEEDIARLKRG
jgi:hypothetical protein